MGRSRGEQTAGCLTSCLFEGRCCGLRKLEGDPWVVGSPQGKQPEEGRARACGGVVISVSGGHRSGASQPEMARDRPITIFGDSPHRPGRGHARTRRVRGVRGVCGSRAASPGRSAGLRASIASAGWVVVHPPCMVSQRLRKRDAHGAGAGHCLSLQRERDEEMGHMLRCGPGGTQPSVCPHGCSQ